MKTENKRVGVEIYTNHYKWNGEALLWALMQACKRVGARGSELKTGFYFREIYEQPDALTAFYLKGVLLAKLEKQKPPFQPGDNVITTNERRTVPLSGLVSECMPPGEIVKIVRVHYDGFGIWRVEIEEHPGLLYRAEDFTLVPATDNPPPMNDAA